MHTSLVVAVDRADRVGARGGQMNDSLASAPETQVKAARDPARFDCVQIGEAGWICF
jgi:hypothetical protein